MKYLFLARKCSFYALKRVFLIVMAVCSVLAAPLLLSAQTVTGKKIKPGKEKIVLDLPQEGRWRSERLRKDVPSIRAWSYAPTRGDTAAMAVTGLETTTIDRRYFPVNARRTMIDKLALVQRDDPGARLEILHEQVEERRMSLIYAVFPTTAVGTERGGVVGAPPERNVLLILAAEGPTAFHSVEIPIPAGKASHELLQEWVDVLRRSEIR